MSANIVMHPEQPVKTKRFVAPMPTVEPTPAEQYAQGKRLYYRAKPLAACVTDEQTRGWLEAEARCNDDYWRGMMAEASTEVM